MNLFDFTVTAQKQLLSMPRDLQQRVLTKLVQLKNHPDIFTVIAPVVDIRPATHRLRIGTYRLLLMFSSEQDNNFEFKVLKIAHRKDIYR